MDEALEANVALTALLDSLRDAGRIENYTPIVPSLFATVKSQEERIAAWKAYWSPEKVAEVRKILTASAKKYDLSPDMFEPFYAMVGDDYEPGGVSPLYQPLRAHLAASYPRLPLHLQG